LSRAAPLRRLDEATPAGCLERQVVQETNVILEVAVLNVRASSMAAFEAAFQQASAIISARPGYVSHQLQRCIEVPNRYILLVHWQSLEAHTIGFRGSPEYQEWKRLLHHFLDPLPIVEHYEHVCSSEA
jgi:heme-degrading monooxygenase HmoA